MTQARRGATKGSLLWATERGRVTVSKRVRCSPQLATLALVVSVSVQAATRKVESIPVPGARAFPESITSTSEGFLFVGRVGDGGIVRVKPRTAESTAFVQPGASSSRSILGVFADEASSTLWACSNDLGALGGPATGSDTGSASAAVLRVGRQEIALGSGRLYALREGPNVPLSFDGVRVIAHAGRWRLDAWVARPVDTTEFPGSTAARDRPSAVEQL